MWQFQLGGRVKLLKVALAAELLLAPDDYTPSVPLTFHHIIHMPWKSSSRHPFVQPKSELEPKPEPVADRQCGAETTSASASNPNLSLIKLEDGIKLEEITPEAYAAYAAELTRSFAPSVSAPGDLISAPSEATPASIPDSVDSHGLGKCDPDCIFCRKEQQRARKKRSRAASVAPDEPMAPPESKRCKQEETKQEVQALGNPLNEAGPEPPIKVEESNKPEPSGPACNKLSRSQKQKLRRELLEKDERYRFVYFEKRGCIEWHLSRNIIVNIYKDMFTIAGRSLEERDLARVSGMVMELLFMSDQPRTIQVPVAMFLCGVRLILPSRLICCLPSI
jgi:hypothetical protein